MHQLEYTLLGLEIVSSLGGLATSSPYFSPNSPPNNPPPIPPPSPLMASSSIHKRRKSLSFISSTLVSLVCSCASCLLKANSVGILVIYMHSLMSVLHCVPLVDFQATTHHVSVSRSVYKRSCALELKRWFQDRTALPRLPE